MGMQTTIGTSAFVAGLSTMVCRTARAPCWQALQAGDSSVRNRASFLCALNATRMGSSEIERSESFAAAAAADASGLAVAVAFDLHAPAVTTSSARIRERFIDDRNPSRVRTYN